MQVGFTLLFLILIDAMAIVVFRSQPQTDPRAFADGYHKAPWTSKYFEEYASERLRWQPYAYWVGEKYAGKYINIDGEGFRHTYRSEKRVDCTSLSRVFVFGGSTIWGEGARDDETVPSWIQKMLDEDHICANVTNLGQIGYVSTQEVLLLGEQIRRGNMPDLVIFYDGYNDVFAAKDDGVAGLTYDEEARGKEFNLFNDRHRLYLNAARMFLMSSGLGDLAKRVLTTLKPGSYREEQGRLVKIGANREKSASLPSNDKLQESVVRIFILNKIFIDATASKYGFRTLSYWQPWLLDKNPLTPYEKSQSKSEILPGEAEFDRKIYARIAAVSAQNGIHDLSGIFRNQPEPYFIDEAHVTGDANRIIAKAMLADIEGALRSGKQTVSVDGKLGTGK